MSDTTHTIRVADDHTIRVADDQTITVECTAPADADCRTEQGCLVVEQAEDPGIDFTEYYGGPGRAVAVVDGMPIDVSWDGECYEWTPAATSGSAA